MKENENTKASKTVAGPSDAKDGQTAVESEGFSLTELTRYKADLESLVEDRTEKLKESEEYSRLILQSVAEGIFGTDADGRCTYANDAAQKMLGYDTEELIGQVIYDLFHHSNEDGIAAPSRELSDLFGPHPGDHQLPQGTRSSGARTVHFSMSPTPACRSAKVKPSSAPSWSSATSPLARKPKMPCGRANTILKPF